MHSSGIDLIIFIGSFALYFLANFFYSTKPTSVDDYNDPNRNFSTIKIAATIIAIWIGSGIIFYNFIASYKHGLRSIVPNLAFFGSFFLAANFISPRISNFFGKSSIAQIMRELWGNEVGIIVTILYILIILGLLSAKFRFTSQLLSIFFSIPYDNLVVISGVSLISYSIFARIKIAVFSDLLQFAIFCCILPITFLIAWKGFSNTEIIWHTLTTNPKFDFREAFNPHKPNFYQMLELCILALMPRFGPMFSQNISMSKNINQSAAAFKITGFVFLTIQLITIPLAIVISTDNPTLSSYTLFKYCIDNYLYNGLKGVVCVSITVLSLCITDFLLLTASSMLAREILKPMGFKWANNESMIFKYFAVIGGIIATQIALYNIEILSILIKLLSITKALVSAPLLFAIFGFRSSALSVLTGMIASIIIMIIYQWKFAIPGIEFFIPGMAANIAFILGSHYLLKQKGGWIGIKGKREFEEFKQEKRRERQKFLHDTFDINFLSFCKQGLPNSASNISFFGLFALVSIFLTQISLPNIIVSKNIALLDFIYPSTFVLAVNLVLYPIWPLILKKVEFLSIVWLLSVLYISIIIPTIFAFISNFLPIQMVIALVNLIALFVMLKWNIALFLLITGGIYASLYLYCFAEHANVGDLQLQISYLLLFLSGALITFLKPHKDEKQNLKLLSDATKQIQDLSEQTLNLLIVKKEIMNNFKQDIQDPIANIGTGAVTLNQNKNTLEKQHRDSAELIYREYRNLQRDINKLVDLSKFNTGKVLLNHQDINFEELVENAISLCKSSDFKNPNLNFKISTQATHLITTCDPDKIFQCLEYLIRNAINFTKKGTIEVLLENQDTVINGSIASTIKCSIIDEGIGIPENELQYIFGPFAKSSYTKNTSKGLGLALCQRIIELHHGTIWAENNKTKPGTTFTFIIPRRPIST